ncbi:hypothetical protein Turpa_2022 [Turneriella parva DSM 21527]|uniref:Uncharacterized protein n=1 Tax=Turneriella parva (strain ATCC BAA-1111 / DSM 21527 / NCTC 11395 / H) TaxID=869212 RepID=I4B5W1_TURPD|nr:hypothetical protein Turpa_2022 [Turneriella parva DSM 21527]
MNGQRFTTKFSRCARDHLRLGRVLGLGRQESLTPHARDVHSVRRNEATFSKLIVRQAAAFE